MVNKNIEVDDQLDVKEVLSFVELAAGHFASAAVSFVDTAAVFEAIAAAAPKGSLMLRLANLGQSLCEQRESDFTEQQTAYEAHVDRFHNALQQARETING
jgi:hypothetical protein